MKTVRATVSLPADQQEKLQLLADANGLYVAWVVRRQLVNLKVTLRRL